MDRVEVVTKPEEQEKHDTNSSERDTIEKLKKLINERDQEHNDEGESGLRTADSNSTIKESETEDSFKIHKSEGQADDVQYDDDGFEIPTGKIPIDGHFSTQELKDLVEIAKKEGFLESTVDVQVADTNEIVGDRVIIKDTPSEEEDDGDAAMEENQDAATKDEQDDKSEDKVEKKT